MSITIAWMWECDICHLQHSREQREMMIGTHVVSYSDIPRQWTVVDDKLICPNHKIIVDPEEKP